MSNKQLKAWRAFIRLKNQLLPRLAPEISRNTALTPPTDFYLLMTLTDSADASLRASEIAESLDWEKSRLSHQISRMEERGLVSRSVCPVDARRSVVSLTSSGRKYVRQAIPGHFESIKHCFGDIHSAVSRQRRQCGAGRYGSCRPVADSEGGENAGHLSAT